jgi:crotonobetainyl-CoA:carnitine CoA-transferase CaiB-like acyl-CoA transferase
MKNANTCVTPVLELDEIVENPHFVDHEMFPEFDHPSVGKVRHLGYPIKFSDTPATFRNFAPTMGQHTEEILGELGYSEQQIEDLRNSGAAQ